MEKKSLIIIIIAIVITIVAVTVYLLLSLPSKPPISEMPGITPTAKKEVVPPPATGNVDDVADALVKEISDEDLLLSEEENDAGLITTDSQEIGDFGQSINDSEL